MAIEAVLDGSLMVNLRQRIGRLKKCIYALLGTLMWATVLPFVPTLESRPSIFGLLFLTALLLLLLLLLPKVFNSFLSVRPDNTHYRLTAYRFAITLTITLTLGGNHRHERTVHE